MTDKENSISHQLNPPVFFGSALIIFAVVLFAVLAPDTAGTAFGNLQNWIITNTGWFYILSVAIFLFFVVGLAFSSYGKIKLGPDHIDPDFSYGSWFAMLFSAGMGIGLLFFGVAEPVMHFVSPPVGEGQTIESAREAMRITFFHWGIHAWAIYAVVALSLAYFSFRHGLPLTIRSALYPILGERIHGPIGHAVDIFAVLGTMFGVATSLGLGVMQVNAGLHYMFDVPTDLTVQILLICGITLLATISVVVGLDGGIRRLSELNLLLAVALLLFVLLAGPTVFLLQTLVQNTGAYLSDIVDKTFNLYAYKPDHSWIGGWTLFYWGWWIAWSPFVGMFIARVSRGRTIREFVIGVLCVPVGFTFMWMTFFGDTAIHMMLTQGIDSIGQAVEDDTSTAIFKFLKELPWSGVMSLLATLLVVTFFVTSSDSGSLVIDMITSGGREEPPVWQRIFWALTEGAVAIALLVAGGSDGLKALQTLSIASALPFAVVMLVMCYALWKALRIEGVKQLSLRHAVTTPRAPAPATAKNPYTWKTRLQRIVSWPKRSEVKAFIGETVKPVLESVAQELRDTGMEVTVKQEPEDRVSMVVSHGEEIDFIYEVRTRGYTAPTFAFPEFNFTEKDEAKHFRAEVYLREGGQGYDIYGYTKEQVVSDVLDQYEKHMHFLHLVR
ncbi:BCCT family transporter [Gallaecimonas pentaromativorans]|uniref:Choline/glycine/proline betaine transport protein n=1 Tax=Gallaecimonas pentaromativorans TaxID=584787 RepID=A0A3N1PDB0_9GAMM|nr:choline BCCT transporter BetT [Gallaecimonas pentaromativorans]ROQ22546.1 choline/glycine/proline betaine transport protein [Gallaecimonas pentaromativorans]